MGLSAQEITNSKAGQYDVELMFYGGPYYNALTLSDYIEGDTSPDTTGFTDITSRVSGTGALTYGRSGNSLRFSATLNGTQYAAAYFAPGRAILCLRRILIAGAQVVPGTGTWELWWLGQINAGAHMDDYQHGGAWSRTVGGFDIQLQRNNAPRLTAGRIDMLSGVAPTASSTLETVALEADSGEFAGVLANVAASNTTDGNLNTLWMSSGVPTLSALPAPAEIVRKVYLEPLAGYDQTKLWWIQFSDNGSNGWIIKNRAGISVWVPAEYSDKSDNILCANKPAFEAYFGSQFEVDNVVDVRFLFQGTGDYDNYPSDNAPFVLNPDQDQIQMCSAHNGDIYGAVAWNQTGANVTIAGWNGGAAGAAIDVSGMAPGTGLLHDADGGDTAGDWSEVVNLSPGAPYDDVDDGIEWLPYILEAQSAALDGACDAGAATITLTSTLGLLDEGTAICEGSDTFTYEGRTSTTLTGVSGITAHASGSSIRQVIGGVAQTGWPCTRFELLRPNNPALPRIAAGRVYFMQTGLLDPGMPGDEGWELDWDPSFIRLGQPIENDGVYDYGATITGPDGGPRWVQAMLVIFDEMTPAGERARLNEAKLYLSQAQVNGSGEPDIGSIKASGLAQYIFNQAGATTNLTDGTSTDFGPWIGEHATGIAPFPQVLDDLARITGCVMDWGLAGIPTWWPDMWWPANYVSSQFAPRADLDAAYLRGQAQFSGQQPTVGGVRVHARTPDGLHQYEATFPTGLADSVLLMEFDDLVTTSPELANDLALTMYYKAGLRYTSGPQQLTFVLKGPGEWLRPEQYIRLACDAADSAQVEVLDSGSAWTGWLVESITWEWGRADAFRMWQATVSCRKYWRGTYTI